MVVSEIQHIEGDISANRLLQHYLRNSRSSSLIWRSEPDSGADSDEAARVYRALSAHRSNLMAPTILI